MLLKGQWYTRQRVNGLSHTCTPAFSVNASAVRWQKGFLFADLCLDWKRRWCVFASGPSPDCAKSRYTPMTAHSVDFITNRLYN